MGGKPPALTSHDSQDLTARAPRGIARVQTNIYNIPDNLNLALASGRSILSLLWEIFILWRGPGKLSPQEYFYFRLWDPGIPLAEKCCFVGKKAQNEMHLACNSRYW
jgi:hypothetical protein